MPGFSPPMHAKHDPNKSLKAVLKKHNLDDLEGDVLSWLDMEPGSPGVLKKQFLLMHAIDDKGAATVNDWDIDLSDPTTWPEVEGELPSDQFFLELFKAIKADERRNSKRSSYEF